MLDHKASMVIGGGIAGIQAALDLDAGDPAAYNHGCFVIQHYLFLLRQFPVP